MGSLTPTDEVDIIVQHVMQNKKKEVSPTYRKDFSSVMLMGGGRTILKWILNRLVWEVGLVRLSDMDYWRAT